MMSIASTVRKKLTMNEEVGEYARYEFNQHLDIAKTGIQMTQTEGLKMIQIYQNKIKDYEREQKICKECLVIMEKPMELNMFVKSVKCKIIPNVITLEWLSTYISWHGLVVSELDFESLHELIGIVSEEDIAKKREDEVFAILDFMSKYNWVKNPRVE